ncbi:hypothetical protein ACJRO7_029445 [Eucalyptus globulus]|uniref:EF-hand domain-containing protein n=1 Tax=Eucalyptus globulus TaxID=34317 RepID=A0ABD3J8N7_EUCGL
MKMENRDLNRDSVLSPFDLRKAFESMPLPYRPTLLTSLYDSVFDRFDCDGSSIIDLEEIRSEMRKIMLALTDGLGSCSIQMVLEDDDPSFSRAPPTSRLCLEVSKQRLGRK